jgi:hypothetical protein
MKGDTVKGDATKGYPESSANETKHGQSSGAWSCLLFPTYEEAQAWIDEHIPMPPSGWKEIKVIYSFDSHAYELEHR